MNGNPRLTYVAISLYALAYALLFATWVDIVIQKVPNADALVNYITATLGALTGHLLTILNPTTPSTSAPPASNGQAGFARVGFLATVALAVASALFLIGGCTTTTASVYSGYYTQAKAGVQTFDDNSLRTMKDLLCAQPYSAIQRNADIQAGVVVLCGPLANTASLDPAQVQLLLNVMKQVQITPAASAGVVGK